MTGLRCTSTYNLCTNSSPAVLMTGREKRIPQSRRRWHLCGRLREDEREEVISSPFCINKTAAGTVSRWRALGGRCYHTYTQTSCHHLGVEYKIVSLFLLLRHILQSQIQHLLLSRCKHASRNFDFWLSHGKKKIEIYMHFLK